MLKSLEFWLDVDEFLKQDDRKEDRLYRVYTAWSIFNRYINEGKWHFTLNFKRPASIYIFLNPVFSLMPV